MLKITKTQYIERWDALPPVLREAMFSPANGEMIWRVGEEHHLKEEQIATIAGICGNIVMGFLHPEDLAKEIKTDTGVDERLAQAIAREIDRKVFSPLRSEIEKIYSPAGPVVEEIIRPEEIRDEKLEIRKEEAEKFIEAPAVEEITGEHKIDISEFRVVGPEEKPFGAEPPAELPSAPVAEQPIELPQKIEEAPAVEAPPVEAPPVEAPPVEAPPVESAEIKPLIIHEEEEIKTAKEAPRPFSLGSIFGFFKKKETKTTEPPTTAEIEMEMPEEPAREVNYEAEPPVVSEAEPPVELPPKIEEEKSEDIIDLRSFERKE
jgi:hypothetical protein